MRFSKWPALLLFMFSVLLIRTGSAVASFSDSDSSDNDDDETDSESLEQEKKVINVDLIEENPSYIPPSKKRNRREFDEEDDSKRRSKRKESKAALSRAVSKPNNLSRRKRLLKLIQKHHQKIILFVTLVVFREEIKTLFINLFTKLERDPKSGKIVRVPVSFSPMAVLKVVLMIDLMRRLRLSSQSDDSSSELTMLLLGSQFSPVLLLFLSKLLAPSNSAYLPSIEQHYTFETINERYKKDNLALHKAMHIDTIAPKAFQGDFTSKPSFSRLLSELNKRTPSKIYNETVVVMDWTGLDASVSQLGALRDKISFLLHVYQNEKIFTHNSTNEDGDTIKPLLEVVILLESPGGSASEYALASEQILRLRNQGIQVTICVDKVAASGGYMIACTSSPGRLFAAPFAVLGSIGVIGQAVNVHKVLKGWGIEPLVFRGGKDKAPVGLIGEVTREGMAKVQKMVDNIHRAFKHHVATSRPILAHRIEALATGDIWLGHDALDLNLVDRIVSSDEYIGERLSSGAHVLKLVQLARPKYPFSPPTTVGSLMTIPLLHGSSVFRDMITECQHLLHKLSTFLTPLLTDEGSTFNVASLNSAASYRDLTSTSS